MNIEIYINNSRVDLSDDNIVLNRQFIDFTSTISDASSHIVKRSTYSFTYTFPVTPTNIKIFRGINALDATDNRFGVIYTCELYVDNELLVNGRFNLTEVTVEGFSGSIYVPQEVSIEDIFGEQKLCDLIADSIDISNYDSITSLNREVLGNPSDSLVCFPYILNSVPSNNYSRVLYDRWTQSLDWSECGFDLRTLYPSFRVFGILERCFESLGYRLVGEALKKKYLSLLWQTYDRGQDIFDDKRKTPYYLSFDYTWTTYMMNGNISSSLSTLDDLDVTWGIDAILQSDNTRLKNVKNDYGMLVESESYGTYSIIVPQSGWYQINSDIEMYMPNEGNVYYSQSGRTMVRGTLSDGDLIDLTTTAYEVQIMRGSNPLSDAKHMSIFNGLPTQTYDYSDSDSRPTVIYGAEESSQRRTGIYPIESAMSFAVNGDSVPIRNLSGYDTDAFLGGWRWGSQVQSSQWGTGKNANAAPNRHEKRPATLALPKSGTLMTFLDGDVDEDVAYSAFQLYRVKGYKDFSEDNTYGSDTAVALTRADSYSNCMGTRKGTVNYDSDGDMTSVVIDDSPTGGVSYAGQQYSSAVTASNIHALGTLHTCVWLDEGDIINIVAIIPYSEGLHRSNHWYSKLKWKDKNRRGAVITHLSGTFEMGLVNTNAEWSPTASDPIITSSSALSAPRKTRIGDLLPDITAQAFLENILTTFNLNIRKTGLKEYSLEESTLGVLDGNVINIDDVSDTSSVVYDVIDNATYTTFGWANDLEEEGYVNGNDSPYCQDTLLYYNRPEHDGGKVVVDSSNTLGDEDKVQSTYSYNWYKTIWFRQDPLYNHSYYIDIPVIASADTWSEVDLPTAQQTITSDGTPRLFYINTSLITDGNSGDNTVVQKVDFIDGTDIKLTLIVPSRTYDRYTLNSSLNSVRKRYVLDYDDDSNNLLQGDEAMSDTYFDADRRFAYTLSVDSMLSNSDYNKITSNSLIVFNDGLYNCSEIQEHHLDHSSPTTLVLVPYKPRRASSAGLYTPQDTQESTFCLYGSPKISIIYNDIPINGGCVMPKVEYEQTFVCDGVIGTLTSGATITYDGTYCDSVTGEVCFTEANEEAQRRLIDGVTVTVTLNGVSATATAQVYQTASAGVCFESLKIERFTYPMIDWYGGDTYPSWTTEYPYTITVTCEDGSIETLHEGATMEYTVADANAGVLFTLDSNTGRVYTDNANYNSAVQYICVVQLTVTYHDLVQTAQVYVHQDYTTEDVCEYYDPVISLSYPDIPAEGGAVAPTLTYRFYYRCSDGTNGAIDAGATVVFSTVPTGLTDDYGVFTWPAAATTTERRSIATVTATVTLNGTTGQYTCTIYQQGQQEITCDYSDVSVNLSYNPNPFPTEGGSFSPTLSYLQYYTCSDGSVEEITSGGMINYTYYPSAQTYINVNMGIGGLITVSENTNANTIYLGYIRCTLTLNGKSGYDDAQLYISGNSEEQTHNYVIINNSGYDLSDYEVRVMDSDGVERVIAQGTLFNNNAMLIATTTYEVAQTVYTIADVETDEGIARVHLRTDLNDQTLTIANAVIGVE